MEQRKESVDLDSNRDQGYINIVNLFLLQLSIIMQFTYSAHCVNLFSVF